jgi:hypothetical protein
VSYDPFGYVTHHYGRWGWSGMYGWYWIPGVYYSPAWVVWNMVDAFFGWAPLGYYNRPIYWGHNSWRHDCWIVVDYRQLHNRKLNSYSRWDSNIGRLFPAHDPNRPLTPAWRQGPLVVTRNEFSNPNQGQLRSAMTREVSAQRLGAYEAQAGRQVVVRREAPAGGAQRPAQERPFEDSSSRLALEKRPLLRRPASAPQAGGMRTADRSGDSRGADRGSTRPVAPSFPRAPETREPGRTAMPPSHPTDSRRPSAPKAREPNRTPEPSRSTETREPSRNPTPPSRPTEDKPALPAAPSSPSKPSESTPSRTYSPSPSSPSRSPSSRPSSPPPDRGRNSRR